MAGTQAFKYFLFTPQISRNVFLLSLPIFIVSALFLPNSIAREKSTVNGHSMVFFFFLIFYQCLKPFFYHQRAVVSPRSHSCIHCVFAGRDWSPSARCGRLALILRGYEVMSHISFGRRPKPLSHSRTTACSYSNNCFGLGACSYYDTSFRIEHFSTQSPRKAIIFASERCVCWSFYSEFVELDFFPACLFPFLPLDQEQACFFPLFVLVLKGGGVILEQTSVRSIIFYLDHKIILPNTHTSFWLLRCFCLPFLQAAIECTMCLCQRLTPSSAPG